MLDEVTGPGKVLVRKLQPGFTRVRSRHHAARFRRGVAPRLTRATAIGPARGRPRARTFHAIGEKPTGRRDRYRSSTTANRSRPRMSLTKRTAPLPARLLISATSFELRALQTATIGDGRAGS